MSQTPTLRQLRAFRLVMSMGGMSAAADALNLTQPALSKQIGSLEETLDLRLFQRRRGGPMVPTKEGLAFYKSIEGTLHGLDAIPGIAQEIRQRVRVELRIAATPPLINSRSFMKTLAEYRALAPDVRVSLAARPRIDLEDWVRNGQADISLGLLPTLHPDLTSTTLAVRAAVAVMGLDHPLAQHDKISERDLEGVALALPSLQPLRERIDAILPGLSAEIETSSSIASVALAVTQNCLVLSDPYSPTMYPDGYAKTLPFEPEIELAYGAIWSRNAQTEQIRADFLELAEKHFKVSYET